MGELSKDFLEFLTSLFNPGTFSIVVTLIAGGNWFLKKLSTEVNDHDEELSRKIMQDITERSKSLTTRIDNLENFSVGVKEHATMNTKQINEIAKDVLRVQIIQGITSKSLSESELMYFYDKYRQLGGNSFVTNRVEKYLEELRGDNNGAKKS
jgi:hypothetical protein